MGEWGVPARSRNRGQKVLVLPAAKATTSDPSLCLCSAIVLTRVNTTGSRIVKAPFIFNGNGSYRNSTLLKKIFFKLPGCLHNRLADSIRTGAFLLRDPLHRLVVDVIRKQAPALHIR